MPIMVRCSGCEAKYSVDEKHAGRTLTCKSCGEKLTIGEAKRTTAPPPTAPRQTGNAQAKSKQHKKGAKEQRSINGRYLTAGAIAALVLAALFLVPSLTGSGAKPDKTNGLQIDIGSPSRADTNTVKPIRSRFKRVGEWKLTPDPSPYLASLDRQSDWSLPPANGYRPAVFPSVHSPFALLPKEEDGTLLRGLADLRSGTFLPPRVADSVLRSLATLSPSGQQVASYDEVNEIFRVFRIGESVPYFEFRNPKRQQNGVFLAYATQLHMVFPTEKLLIVGITADSTTFLTAFDLAEQANQPTTQRYQIEIDHPGRIVVSPGGRYFAIASCKSRSPAVYFYDANSGSPAGKIEYAAGGNPGITTVYAGFSPDGREFAFFETSGDVSNLYLNPYKSIEPITFSCWDTESGDVVDEQPIQMEHDLPTTRPFSEFQMLRATNPNLWLTSSGWLFDRKSHCFLMRPPISNERTTLFDKFGFPTPNGFIALIFDKDRTSVKSLSFTENELGMIRSDPLMNLRLAE